MTLHGRALLADDDPDMRHALARVLRGLGLEVIEAADGGRLLVAVGSAYRGSFSKDDVVLIVTDVCMPVASGLDILEGLRAASWKQPAIVITARDTEDVRREAARLGAIVIAKPIDLDSLERAVTSLLTETGEKFPY